jgi:prevent-host-death family protein
MAQADHSPTCDQTDKELYSVLIFEGNVMRYSTQVKPISYLKANAADVLDKLAETRQPLIITQNGEAKAVMQDLATYENTQATLALLKILAVGQKQIADGLVSPHAAVAKRLRDKVAKMKQASTETKSRTVKAA